MSALRQAEKAPVSTTPSDIDAILAANGLNLADDHPDRCRFGLEVLRAQVKANGVIRERDLGAPIVTAERPSLITPPEVPQRRSNIVSPNACAGSC